MKNMIQKILVDKQPKPLPPEEFHKVKEHLLELYSYEVPKDYEAFMSFMNGCHYKGIYIYNFSAIGIMENFPRLLPYGFDALNDDVLSEWEECNFLFLGECSLRYLAFDKYSEKYVVVYRDDFLVDQVYDSFAEMVCDFDSL